MAVYFKCPHCGKCVVDEQGELCIDYELGVYKCRECGGTMNVETDGVDYDYDVFNN